jgi:hypothetical protein
MRFDFMHQHATASDASATIWSRLGLLALVLFTIANVNLYFVRWADDSLSNIPHLVSIYQISSATIGFMAAVAVLATIELLRGRKFLVSLLPMLLTAGMIWSLNYMKGFWLMMSSDWTSLAVGSVAGFISCSTKPDRWEPHRPIRHAGRAFLIYLLVTANFYLFTSPFSTHLPSMVELGKDFKWNSFYFGSIHADISPIYVVARDIINWFFPAHRISATGLISLWLVSIALATMALVARKLMGPLWAWVFLILCWTDKWIFAGAVASSLIPQPMVVVAVGLLLCTWAALKPATPVTMRQSIWLGLMFAAGTVFCLYSYSGVRFNWITSLAIFGLILLWRRMLPISAQGIKFVVVMALPTIVSVFLLWLLVFKMDSVTFKRHLFTSPHKDSIISSISDTPYDIVPVNEVDMPIWWGTGSDRTRGMNVYWRRTPKELAIKVAQYFKDLSGTVNVASYLVCLGVFALIVGLISPQMYRRRALVLLGVFAILSYLPVLLAQAPDAYRRGVGAELLLMLLLTSIFAYTSRTGLRTFISAAVAICFAIVKAPLELNSLLDDSLVSPVCVACSGDGAVPIKRLVNAPLFKSIQSRNLFFLINDFDVVLHQGGCLRKALNSLEMKRTAPAASIYEGTPRDLAQSIRSLQPGSILILTCHFMTAGNQMVKDACAGKPPEGKFLGSMPESIGNLPAWWVAIER